MQTFTQSLKQGLAVSMETDFRKTGWFRSVGSLYCKVIENYAVCEGDSTTAAILKSVFSSYSPGDCRDSPFK